MRRNEALMDIEERSSFPIHVSGISQEEYSQNLDLALVLLYELKMCCLPLKK